MSESKKEKLAKSSDNVRESIGATTSVAPPAEVPRAAGRTSKTEGLIRMKEVALIPLTRIRPDPAQPRKVFPKEEIDQLADSLKTKGQLQPIRVRWDDNQSAYMIIVGERRFRAAGEAGLEALSCVIHEGEIDEARLRAIQLVENLHRSDLTDIDKAQAMDSLMKSHGWSQRTLAHELNLKQSSIAKVLSLLKLPEEVQTRVKKGEIPAATGYEISKLKTAEDQVAAATEVVETGLGRDGAKALVERRQRASGTAPKKGKPGKPKLKTEAVYNDSGFRFRVECRKGIEPTQLLAALGRWSAQVEASIVVEPEPAAT